MKRVWHRTLITTVALLSGAVLSGGVVRAEIKDKSWEIGAYIFNSSFANDTNMDDTQGFGGRAAYAFKAKHGLVFEIDSSTADDNVIAGREIDIMKYSLAYMHNIFVRGRPKMVAEITFGYGQLELDDGVNTDDSTFILAGGGFKYLYTPHSGLKMDIQAYRWRGNPVGTGTDSFFTLDITLGYSWFFGGTEAE